MKKATITLLLICVAVSAQEKGTFTDSRDGKTYKTVKIGEQVWMAQNLDYHGEDGYLGLCYGDEPQRKIRKPENCKKYGRLYDWNEAMKACPSGWHLPSIEEWQILVDFVGGDDVAGKKLKSKSGWKEYHFSSKSSQCKWTEHVKEQIDNRGRVISPAGIVEYDKCTTDEYGFSALPGGGNSHYDYLSGFEYVGDIGYWWSSTKSCKSHAILSSYSACYRRMSYNSDAVYQSTYNEPSLFSVRCVRD